MTDASSFSPPREDFFQQLADGAPVMIWMSGLDMGCYYFNHAWLDFRGRTLEQESGNGWAEGVHPEDLQRCVNHYIGCFERRMAFAMSYRLQDHAGEYHWILDRGSPHFLPDGRFLGFYGGCAQIDTETSIVRNAELRYRLSELNDFARRLATDEMLASQGAEKPQALRRIARSIHEEHVERLRAHASGEMQRLASDMLTYGRIPHGACLP